MTISLGHSKLFWEDHGNIAYPPFCLRMMLNIKAQVGREGKDLYHPLTHPALCDKYQVKLPIQNQLMDEESLIIN